MAMLERIFGFCEVTVGAAYAEKALNAMMKKRLSHTRAKRNENGDLCFKIMKKDRRLLFEIIDKCAISVYSVYDKGFPSVFMKYRRRLGVAIGFLIFCFCIYISGFYIWDVRVEAEEGVDTALVQERLSDMGFGVGTFKGKFDLYEMCNSYLKKYDDLSFISVNVIGNVAYVDLRARVSRPDEKNTEYSNLVAKYTGIVVSKEVFCGNARVKAGDAVSEGDILVSGVCSDLDGGYYLCKSEGIVNAEIERTFSATVLYEEEKNTEYEGETLGRSLMLFGLEIPIMLPRQSSGKTKTDISRASVDGKNLPFALKTEKELKQKTEKIYRTPENAEKTAQYRVSNEFIKETQGAKILSVTKECTKTETGVTATWTVRCICDIARSSPIYINNTERNS